MKLDAFLSLPGDKSLTHRALILATLAKGASKIYNPCSGRDARSTANCLSQCGVSVIEEPWGYRIDGAELSNPEGILNCGNSGTAARLLTGFLCGQGIQATLSGDESLSNRPMGRIIDPLRHMGAFLEAKDEKLPLRIDPLELNGIKYQLPIASAQVKSALLLAGLGADGATVVTDPFHTRDHTERMFQALGLPVKVQGNKISIQKLRGPIEPFEYNLPGDFSTAAVFIAMATILEDSEIMIRNILLNKRRLGFLRVLERMGSNVDILMEEEINHEIRGDLRVRGVRELEAFTITEEEVVDLIDEIPLLAVLAALSEGESEIVGAEELRFKESDRINSIAVNLNTLGAMCRVTPTGFRILGPCTFKGGKVSSFGDHRIAMAMTVASLVAESSVEIDDEECIGVSCPEFSSLLLALLED